MDPHQFNLQPVLTLNPFLSALPPSLLSADKVEVCDNRVAVCRDHANGICGRQKCKYYHIPIIVPPAPVMAAILHQHSDPPPGTEDTVIEYHHPAHTMTRDWADAAAAVAIGLGAIEGSCTNLITTSELPERSIKTTTTTTTSEAATTTPSGTPTDTCTEGGDDCVSS